MKYTFIHPTKTGGTPCEEYFSNHYSNYITGQFHYNLCNNSNNPIIIIRDPIDRFKSMYKYWKNGSIDTKYKRSNTFKNKYKDHDIKKFISLIKNNSINDLHQDFTWDQHFHPQIRWINNTDYSNIIVIKYEKNLNKKINQLIDYLKIPNKNIELPIKNISINLDISLDNDDINFIKTRFEKDYELIEKINQSSELFKKII